MIFDELHAWLFAIESYGRSLNIITVNNHLSITYLAEYFVLENKSNLAH